MADENIRVLLCEDDENLGMLLCEYLRVKGYGCDLCDNGESGLKAFMKDNYDICIFDVMMPKKDGFTLASDVHSIKPDTPVIFLTAKNLKDDIIEGFRRGCDDYITKPFSMEELLCRMEAILRRLRAQRLAEKRTYFLGKYIFDSQKQQLRFIDDDTSTKLTTKEADLLALFCNNVNEILSRNYALKTIWIEDTTWNARSMDVYITKLRKFLAKDPTIQIINIHGKGYKLVVPGAKGGNNGNDVKDE